MTSSTDPMTGDSAEEKDKTDSAITTHQYLHGKSNRATEPTPLAQFILQKNTRVNVSFVSLSTSNSSINSLFWRQTDMRSTRIQLAYVGEIIRALADGRVHAYNGAHLILRSEDFQPGVRTDCCRVASRRAIAGDERHTRSQPLTRTEMNTTLGKADAQR
jgi:hypothetical protein